MDIMNDLYDINQKTEMVDNEDYENKDIFGLKNLRLLFLREINLHAEIGSTK